MKKILPLLLVLFSSAAIAQQDFLMYGLQGIPQSAYNNPSNRFDGKFYIGLPALSSNYFSYTNSGFRYSEAIVPSGDSLLLDFDELISNIDDQNYLSFATRVDLLSFGFSIGERTQITVNITENIDFRFGYPKDFMVLVHEGNTAFEGREADLEGIGIGMNHYREYGLGVSHQLNDKLRLGLRAKYLYGMENIYSEKADISLQTDPITYEITTQSDVTLRTAGLDQVDDDESAGDYLMGRKNQGFAVDLGANYQLNDKWSFNASVIDFGYIRWNSYTKSYKNDGAEYTYSGIAVDAFSQSDSSGSSFDRVLDSLEKELGLVESDEAYTSPLTTRVHMGANYEISERDFAGVLVQTDIFQNSIKPSFTLSYNRKMNKWITLATSYTVINKSYDNVGLGVIFDPGPVQFYMVSDNVLGAIRPQHAKHLQVRFGINLIFGRNKTNVIRPDYSRNSFNPSDSLPKTSPTDSLAPLMEGLDSMLNDSIPVDSILPIDTLNTLDSLQNGDTLAPVLDTNAIDSIAPEALQDSSAVDSSLTSPEAIQSQELDSADSETVDPVLPDGEPEGSIESAEPDPSNAAGEAEGDVEQEPEQTEDTKPTETEEKSEESNSERSSEETKQEENNAEDPKSDS